MKRFKNILFINYGETEREVALQRAVDLAKINQALLTVVEVLEELPNETQSSIEPENIKDFEKIAVKESNERLGNLIAPIKQQRVRVTRKVLQGTPFLEIIREVLRNKHDLVMVSPRKKAKLKGRMR